VIFDAAMKPTRGMGCWRGCGGNRS
jgi:hypothetical protein